MCHNTYPGKIWGSAERPQGRLAAYYDGVEGVPKLGGWMGGGWLEPSEHRSGVTSITSTSVPRMGHICKPAPWAILLIL